MKPTPNSNTPAADSNSSLDMADKTSLHPLSPTKAGCNERSDLKLLFIAYYFPPLRTIASVRTSAMAKYLSRLGWHVTVLTPSPNYWRVVDSMEETDRFLEQEGIDRVITGHSYRFLHPVFFKSRNTGMAYLLGGAARRLALRLGLELELGWTKHALKSTERYHPGEFDLVLASGGPFLSFRLAQKIAERVQCPFVIDYRDLWHGDPHDRAKDPRRAVNEEGAILQACASATIVSPSLSEYVSQYFNLTRKPVVIGNGFDYEELQQVKATSFDHFAIVYGGTFYPPDIELSPLMKALQRLKENGSQHKRNWLFHYYGSHDEHVRQKAAEFGVLDKVIIHGHVPRSEVLSAVRGANVAVVVTSTKETAPLEYQGVITGKLFEPLGMGTPVLLIAPRVSDASKIVAATGAGAHFTGSEDQGMYKFLDEMINGRVMKPRIPLEFSWDSLSRQMDSLLRSAVKT